MSTARGIGEENFYHNEWARCFWCKARVQWDADTQAWWRFPWTSSHIACLMDPTNPKEHYVRPVSRQYLDTTCTLCEQPITHNGADSGAIWSIANQVRWEPTCWGNRTPNGGYSGHVPQDLVTEHEVAEAMRSIGKDRP